MKGRVFILGILLLLSVIWNIALYLNPDRQTSFNYLFNVCYGLLFLFGGLVAHLEVRKYQLSSNFGKSLFFYSESLWSYAMGLFAWAFYNLILKEPVPYPGLPDVFFLLFQPLSALGFLFLVRAYGGRFTPVRIVEFSVLFVLLFGILYAFLLQDSLSPALPFLTRAFNVIYPAFDAFLISLVITGIRTEKGALHPNLLIFAFAALTMAFADTAFSYRSAQGVYWNGDVADTLFMIAAFLFGLGLITISSQGENAPSNHERSEPELRL